MIYQRTIKSAVSATGVGLHSGLRVALRLLPAPENTGIIFIRTDLANKPQIQCQPQLVNDTRLSSTLVFGPENVRIATIEHLMSALASCGIDNIQIELSAAEVPIMDGSSNSFIYLLEQAQIVEQKAKKKYIQIVEEIKVTDKDKSVTLKPYFGYKLSITVDFNHALFDKDNSSFAIDFAKSSYIDEISRARTFGFMYEVENLRKNGLGLGGNLSNAIVIDEDEVLNSGGLRFTNEFVRHKILDAIGDLYIAGHQIIGEFIGYKSGHDINNKLLRHMLDSPAAWKYVSFDSEHLVPQSFHHI